MDDKYKEYSRGKINEILESQRRKLAQQKQLMQNIFRDMDKLRSVHSRLKEECDKYRTLYLSGRKTDLIDIFSLSSSELRFIFTIPLPTIAGGSSLDQNPPREDLSVAHHGENKEATPADDSGYSSQPLAGSPLTYNEG